MSLCKYDSIKEGSAYDPQRIINVRGISSGTERTIGKIEMKLSTENKTTHVFI